MGKTQIRLEKLLKFLDVPNGFRKYEKVPIV